jgi:hypothetical protein
MTIDEAIKTLSDSLVGVEMVDDPDLPDALKLGIEALKRVKSLRASGKPDRWSILKGETKE